MNPVYIIIEEDYDRFVSNTFYTDKDEAEKMAEELRNPSEQKFINEYGHASGRRWFGVYELFPTGGDHKVEWI